MNLSLPSPAKLAAVVIHAVTAEYRKLDAPPAPPPEPVRQEMSCTSASTQTTWQPATRPAASPRAFGFRRG